MIANEFNELYEQLIVNRLTKEGYYYKGKSLFLTRGDTVAALLRRTYRGEQAASFVYCCRHQFLRDQKNLSTKNIYLTDAVDYPFRFSIRNFNEEDLFTVGYESINYLRSHSEIPYDEICYGDSAIENKQGISDELTKIADKIIYFGPKIMNLLSPAKSLSMLQRNSKGAWIEQIWIEDYKSKLS